MYPQPKPTPRLLEKKKADVDLARRSRIEDAKVKRRSEGRCEVIFVLPDSMPFLPVARCVRPACEIHHLIGGSGRRNIGISMLAKHKLHVCATCHPLITGHVLVPQNFSKRERASTVRYERVRL